MRFFLILLCILCAKTNQAQSGRVIYLEYKKPKSNTIVRIPPEMLKNGKLPTQAQRDSLSQIQTTQNGSLVNFINESQKNKLVGAYMALDYTATQSLYRNYEKMKKMKVKALRRSYQNTALSTFNLLAYQRHAADSNLLLLSDFQNRYFRYPAPRHNYTWKITNQKAIIANQTCLLATTQTDNGPIKAWFCPDIPVPAGPQHFEGLPGLILKVDIYRGTQIIEAQQLQTLPQKKLSLHMPKKGKYLSNQDYKAMCLKKSKEADQRRTAYLKGFYRKNQE